MSAQNPYERRRGARMRGADLTGMVAGDGWPRESPITMQELEALAFNARRRGRREAAEQHAEELQVARRESWQEGYDVGEVDGRQAMLARIESRCGEEVRAAIKATDEMLAALEANARGVSKADLSGRCLRLRKLLEKLVHEHHFEFDETPF